MGMDVWFGPSRQQQLFCLGTEVFWLLVENDEHRGTQEQRDDAGSTSGIQKGGDGEGCYTLHMKLSSRNWATVCLSPWILFSAFRLSHSVFFLRFLVHLPFMHCFVCQGRPGLVGIRVPDH